MRTEKKKLLVISLKCAWDVRPESLDDSKNHQESWPKLKICQIWSNTAATGLEYFRSGATPLQKDFTGHFFRKISNVEQHGFYGTAYGSIRSEQEVSTFQIWSNTPTIKICGLIRSEDSIIQIWSFTAATGRCTGQFASLCITTICYEFFFLRRLRPVTLGIAFI